jgi:uncharacterized protein
MTREMTEAKFRKLEGAEIERVLGANNIGRIAFAQGGRVEIIPIHYIYDGDWIYGRTSPGSAIQLMGEKWWPVAFEVDETEGLFDWRSVIVHGGLYTVSPEGPEWEKEAVERGVQLLRELIPQAFRDDDPVPVRTTIFRIAVQEVSGRAAATS